MLQQQKSISMFVTLIRFSQFLNLDQFYSLCCDNTEKNLAF